MTDREKERGGEIDRQRKREGKEEDERAETSGKTGTAALVPNKDNERISVLHSVARLIKREDSYE